MLQAAPKLCSPYIRFAFSRPGVPLPHSCSCLLIHPQVFIGLGHFLRGLGGDLNRTLAGMDGRPGATTAGAAAERPAQHFQRAVLKVACAVAVLVLTRRIALARLVL